jgi:hypothetical protein
MKRKYKPLYALTLLTAISSIILALVGLADIEIYTLRINQISKYELLGQDTVTLIISLLFLVFILVKDYNKIKTKIVVLGFLMYVFYIYAYFSLGGVSSIYYLAYIALTGLSLYLIIFTIIEIIRTNNLPVITEKYPVKSISIFLILCISIVGLIEIIELIDKTILNSFEINPFYVFYVLDLAIVFPLIIITALYNLKKSQWGYLFTGISLIKIATILPAVIMNDVFHKVYTGSFIDLTFSIIATIITVCALIFLIIYFKNVQNT